MTPEEKSLLERTAALVQENNQILHSIRRTTRWATAMRIAYWAVIIIVSVGAYYFIQPYLTLLTGLSGGAGGFNMNSAQEAAQQLQSLLK